MISIFHNGIIQHANLDVTKHKGVHNASKKKEYHSIEIEFDFINIHELGDESDEN